MTKHVYSVEEAAGMLGISRNSAYEAIRTGQLPSIRIGKRLIVPRAALNRMLDQDEADAASATAASEQQTRVADQDSSVSASISADEWVRAVLAIAKVFTEAYVADHPNLFELS